MKKRVRIIDEADFIEISGVDRPACELALNSGVQLVKRLATAEPVEDEMDRAVDAMPVEHRGSVLKFVGRLFGKANGIFTAAAEEKKPEVKAKVKKGVTPERLQKSLYGVAQLAQLVQSLDYLVDDNEYEAEREGDASPVPGRLAAARDELGQILVAMVEEEVAEIADGTEEEGEVAMALSAKIQELLKNIKPDETDIEKAGKKISAENMALIDKALGHLHKAQSAHGAIEKMHKAAGYDGMDDKLSEMEGHHASAEKCLKTIKDSGGDMESSSKTVAVEANDESDFIKHLEGITAELKSQREATEKTSADLKKQTEEIAALKLDKAKLQGALEALGKQPAAPKARLMPVFQGDAERRLALASGGQEQEEIIDPNDPNAVKKSLAAKMRKGGTPILNNPNFHGSVTGSTVG
jgi:hypothetical protein